jgi:hypothetical protein
MILDKSILQKLAVRIDVTNYVGRAAVISPNVALVQG